MLDHFALHCNLWDLLEFIGYLVDANVGSHFTVHCNSRDFHNFIGCGVGLHPTQKAIGYCVDADVGWHITVHCKLETFRLTCENRHKVFGLYHARAHS